MERMRSRPRILHPEDFVMRGVLLAAVGLGFSMLLSGQAKSANGTGGPASAPGYTSDGRMLPPIDYRQWIFLTSGMDMSYTPRMSGANDSEDMHMFDNVFVNPASWKAFQETGTWPDKTVFVLEFRGAENKVSINKAGRSQGGAPMGLEVHVKDASRGGWAFYEFNDEQPAKIVPKDASCYACHQAHAAVDTTFVQFYPTLLPTAKAKGTLSAAYLGDEKK